MKKGTQIIYVPTHAKGDLNHPDCEKGFVTSIHPDIQDRAVFCRYWNLKDTELRTKANSELTPLSMLVIQDTHPQEEVDKLIELIEKEEIL